MYFKILEIFILKTLFSKGEYNITNKNFNPIKFIIVLFLVGNFIFTIYLLNKISTIYDHVARDCPVILVEHNEHDKHNEIIKNIDTSSKKLSDSLVKENAEIELSINDVKRKILENVIKQNELLEKSIIKLSDKNVDMTLKNENKSEPK